MSFNLNENPLVSTSEKDHERHNAVKRVPFEETVDSCRICRGEASPQQPLYHPCKCSGSIKFVHQECLMEWLSHSQKKYCELCKTSFRFTKLYDHSMPHTLPFPLFLRQVTLHALVAFARYTRYLLVALVWTCCLPWCIRQIWRGLFWLADGNWLDELDMQAVSDNASSITTTSSIMISPETPLPDPDIPDTFESIRVVFSQGLFGRIIQFLFTLVLPPSTRRMESSTSDIASPPSSYRRPSSLFSDVKVLTGWSRSPVLNNSTIDIIEGQLICILLVTAFILVFLIREWVINQQPIHNMPDPDGADNAPVLPQADAEAPIGAPMHRRNPGLPLEDNTEQEAIIQPQHALVVPRLRRALTDDNILNAAQADFERPVLPVRSRSLLTPSDLLDGDETIGQYSEEDPVIIPEPDARTAVRRTLSNSILVRSEVEIVPGSDVADITGQNILVQGVNVGLNGNTGVNDRGFFPGQLRHARLTNPDVVSPAADLASSMQPDVLNQEQEDEYDEEEPLNEGNLHQERSSSTLAMESEAVSESTAHTSPLQTNSFHAEFDSPHGHRTIPQPGTRNSQTPIPEPAEESSHLQKFSAWLWHVDDVPQAVPAPFEAAASEHIIQDLHTEAPFVPVHDPIRELEDLQALDPPGGAPAPIPREPNIVLGVDLNDPNAVDDAEDLDGILELLGMEGPIFGMVQNVVFSLFLITITLSASIWCPYIWGKIALLFISNPVGMLVKAPLFILSRGADIVIDVIFFVAGLTGLMIHQPLKLLQVAADRLIPASVRVFDLDVMQNLTMELSQKSGARLEKTLSGAFLNLKPDLPTFSMLSHHALRSFKASSFNSIYQSGSYVVQAQQLIAAKSITMHSVLPDLIKLTKSVPKASGNLASNFYGFATSHILGTSPIPDTIDNSLVAWNTEDRIITIFLGYAFLAAAGVLFLEVAHMVLGLKEGEKVEGYFADCLRQAGGVMKVIVIIGIEMLVFPLYCGLLLDIALLPLFANATLVSRVAFLLRAPFTGIFIHWFIGTCYMFHFALFVSICRKILRKGVLYFIRDPDDPTFHPVRDVLERPVPTQLGKIAFSALVYGGLVMICLGGVVWTLDRTGIVLPIQWATSEPKLAFPVDIVFYNFMLPFFLRKADPPQKITSLYEWWFRRCAEVLRITAFLFGEERKDEKSSSTGINGFGFLQTPDLSVQPQNGTYVRAPASDSVRIPRGQSVFLEVNEHNERVDGQPDFDTGIHGKNDDRFVKIYLPPNFRSRIAAFIFLLWVFAASTGVAFTIGPLLLGRKLMQWLSQSTLPPNDLYAFTLGVHIFALATYGIVFAEPTLRYCHHKYRRLLGHYREALTQVIAFTRYVSGLVYLGVFATIVLPCVLATIVELYLHIPLFTYLESGRDLSSAEAAPAPIKPAATIFILQTWTIGLLYLRLSLRLFLQYIAPHTQAAIALRAIVRNGILRPDVPLASRAFVLPATFICILLLGMPLALAKASMVLLKTNDEQAQTKLYQMTYPVVLGICLVGFCLRALQLQVTRWRVRIRDEVYLIGERLHNFPEARTGTRPDKGKGVEFVGTEGDT